MDRHMLVNQLHHYSTPYAAEKKFIPGFLMLLSNHSDCYQRSLTTGHITGSAWIIDESKSRALLTYHKKLNKWLQLGGHADGNENIIHVSQKEAEEESGLTSIHLISRTIFDIDIHQIPQYANVPVHYHYDIRFLFTADHNEKLKISSESKDLKWLQLDQLGEYTQNNGSILRMVEKSQTQIFEKLAGNR